MIKDKLEKILGFEIEATENPEFGDYTANIAMSHKPPREFAQKLVEKLKKDKELSKIIEKIDVAGPGFINFWLKTDVLVTNLMQIEEEKGKYGKTEKNKGKFAIVEYSSPNIAKPFGVGHLRSTVIGDAVANLIEATGWKVMRDNHLGDWGTQFGKVIYAIKTWGNEAEIEKSESPVEELVKLYVKFHEEAQKDESLEDEARAWFKKLESGDTEARRLWQKCVDWSWIEFNKVYEMLGIKFSPEFNKGRGLGESFFETRMKQVIDEFNEKKLLKVGEDGAKLVFFEAEKYPPLMIIKKDGATLYATRDLATDKYRKEKYDPDLIINEVGSEQGLYFKQLFEVEILLGWYKESQRIHVGHGLFLLDGKKMSTRAGKTVKLYEVLTEAINIAKGMVSSKGKAQWDVLASKHPAGVVEHLGWDPKKVPTREYAQKEIDDIGQKVGIGAIKYFDLSHQPQTNINFDWVGMFAMEGNSGPYLQYTVARTNSVLAKAPIKGGSLQGEYSNLNDEEMSVMRTLIRFPEVIETAAKSYSPNLLCNYLYDLASKYNAFYNKDKIIGSENEGFRLALTAGVGQVLKNGLKLLGIETPERM